MSIKKVRDEPRIPDHEVLRQIGGGAYGEVWLARGVTGAMRAVKVVHSDDFENEREFEREFQGILRYEPISRDHPALVHILHVGRSDGAEPFYYYVMELGDDVVMRRDINPVEYEPRTLRTDMRHAAGKPLDTDFCIRVGRSLSEGLAHLHGHGLAHRDVKPANVIFVDGKAKLADIGLVALRGQQTFVGTEGFVPPEGPGSAQADVYSLGKVLYEMATGKDRLDFPELPDHLPISGEDLKRWRNLNGIICDICEPRISRRKIATAEELAAEFARLEAGLRRPMELNPAWSFLLLLGALGICGGWYFGEAEPWVVRSGGEVAPFSPPPVDYGLVTVLSDPLGVDVYSQAGEFIDVTPLNPQQMPVGTYVSFEFRMRGYQSMTKGGVVSELGLVIDPTLKIYAPPQPGEPWEDKLGMTYRWEVDSHVSHYYVGQMEWETYLRETDRTGGLYVELSENGRKRTVVLAEDEEARGFVEWLTERCRDGYLNDDQILEARLDHRRDLTKEMPEGVPAGRYPFRCAALPGARILFTSEPSGANVYLNGVFRGTTPLVEEDGEPGIPVAPGEVLVSLEADGYQTVEKSFTLKPDEIWDVSEHFVMEKNRGVVFGRPWENSLGMKFAPFGDDLMVAVWETRVSDYAALVKDPEAAVFAPQAPDFAQEANHPVVNVSREDAIVFCQWLTELEHKRDRISKTHEYRLPTDLEWSALCGLKGEMGDWPQERHGAMPGYPWGQSWPPPEGAGNYADESALDLSVDRLIRGYKDGFPRTAPVGSFAANSLGLHDLGGNVYEWVQDDYNKAGVVAREGVYGVLRGGGWQSYRKDYLATSARLPRRPTDRNEWTGFRVVLAKVSVKKENAVGETPFGPLPNADLAPAIPPAASDPPP